MPLLRIISGDKKEFRKWKSVLGDFGAQEGESCILGRVQIHKGRGKRLSANLYAILARKIHYLRMINHANRSWIAKKNPQIL
jgi:hypothetical protein